MGCDLILILVYTFSDMVIVFGGIMIYDQM